jgi:conjugative transfer signal peptidase TraF
MTMNPTHGRFSRLRSPSIPEIRKLVMVTLATGTAAFVLCAGGGLRLNSTASLPIGLYIVSEAKDANLAEFCPPEPFAQISVSRGYRSQGNCSDGESPLLKPVVAKPGDAVVFSDSGLQVNGVPLSNTAPRSRDSKGRPLPHYPFGMYRVCADTVWVASSYHPLSFDSRYFGPIQTVAIRNRLKPLLTL